jgi:hypothetical protein
VTSEGLTFGFEINAAAFGQSLFTQVMLTDVKNQVHYVQNASHPFSPQWAQSDVTQDWYVNQPYPNSGAPPDPPAPYVYMSAPKANPIQNKSVKAMLIDDSAGKTVVTFDLMLSQEGDPMLIWGTGIQPSSPGGLQTNNYYYSLTRLQATGTITIGGQSYAVTGVTWMDHEYGFFGPPGNSIRWILQGIQLDNGVTVSNYTTVGSGQPALRLNEPNPSQATVQFRDGTTYYVSTFMTPRGTPWVSPESGKTYYLEFQVDLPSFNAAITVTSLLDSQEFVSKLGPFLISEVYEGVASAKGTFMGQDVTGTAWNEQAPA